MTMKSLAAISTLCVILINAAASMYPPGIIPYELRGIPLEPVHGLSEDDFYNSFKRSQEVEDAVEHARAHNHHTNPRGIMKNKPKPICNEERISLRIGANDKEYDYKPRIINIVNCSNKTDNEPKKTECRCPATACTTTKVDIDLFKKPKFSLLGANHQKPDCWEFVMTMAVPVACECRLQDNTYEPRPKKPYPSSQIEGRDTSNNEDL